MASWRRLVALIVRAAGTRPDPYAAYTPTPVVGQIDLPLDRQVVNGESHYQPGIARAVAQAGRELVAVLHWEPNNPFATNGNAVRVSLIVGDEHIKCGYIPSAEAAMVRAQVQVNADAGLLSTVDATILGGDADRPSFGVFLGDGWR